jgi:DsbC/DsbD-like thiol-disulfide interchange protein
MMSTLRPLALAAALAGFAAPVAGQSVSDILSAELLPGWTTERGTRMAAIRLTLSQGWKTYWRSPGDAGIPPVFDWSGSDNIGAVRLHWPSPQVFDFNGMQTIGYARELVLPVEIWPQDATRAMRLQTEMDLGVCHDICVPASVTLAADLTAPLQARDPAIRAALRARPATAGEAGVRRHSCTVDAAADGVRLQATIDMPRLGPDEVVVIETADATVWVAETTVRRDGRRLIAETDLVSHDRQPFALDRQGLTISVLAGGKAVELSGCPAP